MTAIIAVPGVLRDEGGAPVQSMLQLVLAMLPNVRVVLSSPEETDRTWCEREQLLKYGAMFEQGELLDVLSGERVNNYVDIVFTPDTDDARSCAQQGVSVALVAASNVVNPKWRPSRKGWGEIVEEYA